LEWNTIIRFIFKPRKPWKNSEISIKDAGWILKKVLENDERKFETKKESLIRKYKWIK